MRVASLVFTVALVGCGESAAPEPRPAPTPAPPTLATVSPTPEVVAEPEPEPEPLRIVEDLSFPPGTFGHDALLEALRGTATRQFKPMGTSALVFRTRLRSEHTLAFKPRTRTHRDGWQHEIAAYRIGRLMGLQNVPPATVRRVPAWEIRDRIHPDFGGGETWRDLYATLVPEPNDEVPGAAIYWVPGLGDLGLDRGRGLTQWREWLAQDGRSCPRIARRFRRDLSNMLVFDYLVANWDRFSGGNVQGIESELGPRVIIRDHDITLASSITRELHDRIRERLGWTERFSRGVVDAVRRMDREAVVAALETEPSHASEPLLPDAAIDAVLERRATLLSYVGALIDRYGEDAVLVFP
ncbi:MAG: hypothetical protein R3B99_23270 [Polyangiales bacterium]